MVCHGMQDGVCYTCQYIGHRTSATTTREIVVEHSGNGCMSVSSFYVGRGLVTVDISSRQAIQLSVRFQNPENGRSWTALVCHSVQEEYILVSSERIANLSLVVPML